MIKGEIEEAQKLYEQTRRASRVYKDFFYRTLNSWTAGRRVIAKAEHREKGANPRFIVTSLKSEDRDARHNFSTAIEHKHQEHYAQRVPLKGIICYFY